MNRNFLAITLVLLTAACQARPSQSKANPAEKNWWNGAMRQGEDLLHAETSNAMHMGWLVTYRAAGAGPASCEVSIFDLSGTAVRKIASNDQLFDCAEVATAQEATAQTEVKVRAQGALLKQTQGNSNSEFELGKSESGDWVVLKATYVRPETDPASGDLIVVQKSARFLESAPTVEHFTYDGIKAKLIRSVIE